MTMTRRSLFGLALAPLVPTLPAKGSFLAPGQVTADPPVLITDPFGGPFLTALRELDLPEPPK